MYYIQRKDNSCNQLETIDEFETRKEAFKMLLEYRMCDNFGYYYISRRSCKEWKI